MDCLLQTHRYKNTTSGPAEPSASGADKPSDNMPSAGSTPSAVGKPSTVEGSYSYPFQPAGLAGLVELAELVDLVDLVDLVELVELAGPVEHLVQDPEQEKQREQEREQTYC